MREAILLLSMIFGGDDCVLNEFADVQIREPYRTYLLAEPQLMQVRSATVIELGEGMKMLTAVASAEIKSDSPQHRLEAERICQVLAMAAIVSRNVPFRFAHSQQVRDRVIVKIENGQERAESVSEMIETVRTRVVGTAHQLPVVGRWTSNDGRMLFLAIGTIVDRSGKRVPDSHWNPGLTQPQTTGSITPY